MTAPLLIDITMTATYRPDILFRTFDSFYLKCLKPVIDQCRLIINIDPIGNDVPIRQMVQLCQNYFKHTYINLPMEPSFPDAFIWTWSKVTAPWAFNIEEDWELLQEVDIHRMIEVMKNNRLDVLRLPFTASDMETQKNWRYRFPWTGEYFACPEAIKHEVGFCGHPSLIRGDFVQSAVPCLTPLHNPEKQFHGGYPAMIDLVNVSHFGTYGFPGEGPYVRDIGRAWMMEHGFRKQGNKAWFTRWEKVPAE